MTTLGSRQTIIKNISDNGDLLATIVMDAVTTELLAVLGSHVQR